jgi:septal ring factor EnvC (AmiA/AmiB activator)
VASLAKLVERAKATRDDVARVRSETARLSHESAEAVRRLTEQRESLEATIAESEEIRNRIPTWPAWAPPNSAELRSTLVPLE